MAKVDDAFTTYSAQANREDLSNVIYNIDPFNTPIMSVAGRRNVSNVVYDWQKESLPAVDVTSDLEGFELDRAAGQPTVRLSNVAQIKHVDATVSGSQNAANPAGKKKEMAHQIALKSKALKRDMESVLFGTIQVKQAGNDTTARTTYPLANWLVTNVDEAGDTTAPDGVSTAVVDGTQRAFTEDMLNDTMELCYIAGAEPSILFTGSFNKRVSSGFTGRTNTRQNIAVNKVVNSVSIYATDFGDLKMLPNRWIRARDAFLIDPRYLKIAYYRNFQKSELAKIGDAETQMITVEFGLQVDNEAAHGMIRDLTTS